MNHVSTLHSVKTPDVATPTATAILESVPGIGVVIRDGTHTIAHCNETYATNFGAPREELIGSQYRDICGSSAAEERIAFLDRVIGENRAVNFLQFWKGKAWLGRFIPLDADAYGMTGTLGVVTHAPIGTALAKDNDFLML